MTNYEHIKNMSKKEMAEWLDILDQAGSLVCYKNECKRTNGHNDCVSCYRKFLDEEVQDERKDL